MTQKTGALIFDETADRYDIRFDVNDYYGGLHCGDCMEVFVRGKWKKNWSTDTSSRVTSSYKICKLGCCPLFSMDAIYRGAIFSVSAN